MLDLGSQSRYSWAEVAFMLSVATYEDALAFDTAVPSSLRHVSPDSEQRSGDASDEALPVVVRWVEVQQARARVKLDQHQAEVLERRLQGGETCREVEAATGINSSKVERGLKNTIRLVLDELGGEAEPTAGPLDRPTMCLRCGQLPRARLRKRRIQVAGKRITLPERPASLCSACFPEADREQLVGYVVDQVAGVDVEPEASEAVA